MLKIHRLAAAVLIILALPLAAQARSKSAPHTPVPAPAPAMASVPSEWVGTWATPQQLMEGTDALAGEQLADVTLRQIVHVSLGGNRIRVRLSNRYGTVPLAIDTAHVALAVSPTSAAIDPASDRALTFSGQTSFAIPPGADFVSDPVDIALPPSGNLAITIHLAQVPALQTGHPFSNETSYFAHATDVSDPAMPGAAPVNHWYFLARVEVSGVPGADAVVTLGDSITDGTNSTLNGNARWPDFLAARLQSDGRKTGVLNEGLHGNRLLLDGTGTNALARFDGDVLSQDGVRTLIVLEGTNDLGNVYRTYSTNPADHARIVADVIAGLRQIITRAHAHGIKVIGGTLLPMGGSDWYHPRPIDEADRQAVNAWIRTSGAFDDVIDFDAAIRDLQDPSRMAPQYDSGDHLHPGAAGYAAMANAIPLSLIE